MKDKYMLIEVIERNITEPMTFDTLEDAQEEMLNRFAETMGYEAENQDDLRAQMEEDGYDETTDTSFGVSKAYCEVFGQNFDWQIFQKEDNSWIAI